jgi:hypothetical protein
MTRLSSRFRRVVGAATVAVVLLAALSAPAGAAGPAAKPSGAYTAVITTDGSCGFTLKATWPGNSKVATVYGLWYMDDAWLFTTQAPLNGPNGGTIKGRTATITVGPLAQTTPHSFRVLTQFYSAEGAHLFEMDSNTLTEPCGVAAP